VNEDDRWLQLDGPAPRDVREILDAAYDVAPEAPEEDEEDVDDESVDRGVLARIAAELAVRPRAEVPPAAPAPALPVGTGMALDLPPEVWRERAKLPFVSPDQVPPRKRAALTEKLPVWGASLGETVPLGSDAITKAVATVPFSGSTASPTVIPFPNMLWKRYIALCAELHLWPAEWAAILRRYEVPSKASLQALHEHWQARLAAHPDWRPTFSQTLASYVDCLSAVAR